MCAAVVKLALIDSALLKRPHSYYIVQSGYHTRTGNHYIYFLFLTSVGTEQLLLRCFALCTGSLQYNSTIYFKPNVIHYYLATLLVFRYDCMLLYVFFWYYVALGGPGTDLFFLLLFFPKIYNCLSIYPWGFVLTVYLYFLKIFLEFLLDFALH